MIVSTCAEIGFYLQIELSDHAEIDKYFLGTRAKSHVIAFCFKFIKIDNCINIIDSEFITVS